ncbi:MAG: hypothetical protein MI749_05045 [Desulfovibrionales bacterium]|nr:hypothetical protein [Desulfovibrionales bacterium]
MPNQETQLLGGWTKFEPCSGEDCDKFKTAMSRHTSAQYEPFSVAKQIDSNRTNYRFLCNGAEVRPAAQNQAYKVMASQKGTEPLAIDDIAKISFP